MRRCWSGRRFKVCSFSAAEMSPQFRLQLPARPPDVSLLPGADIVVRGNVFVKAVLLSC